MSIFKGLTPEPVWSCFEEICKVPRPSKKEEKIIAFLLEWAKKNNIVAIRDDIGNIIMKKPAFQGQEKLKTVVLQCHVDMVCEKNSDVQFNFEKDAIQAYIDGEWVKAKGTTLGADDGIGMAAQMAVLTAKDIKHGPLECLFTVDEETGLTGAFGLKPGFFDGKILINLDSEDEGRIFIGCAGGIDTVAVMQYNKEKTPSGHIGLKLTVKGLKGGHSGDDIEKGRGNANKILNRILWKATGDFDTRLSSFDGGNLRNAIPREAFAIITLQEWKKDWFEKFINSFTNDVKFELLENEPDLTISFEDVAIPDFIIDTKTQKRLLNSLYTCPHGVMAMSFKLPGLVETSTNLASVKFLKDNHIEITTSQRSSIESSKKDVANMVESVFIQAGAKVTHSDGYPGWTPNPNSEILKIAVDSYEKLYGTKPLVKAIHAGLECGLFLEKYPGLDMISIGPTLRGVHSPDERLEIKSVEKFWKHLVDILENVPMYTGS